MKETSVYGVHIVTAVGNLNALDEIGIINSGIYGGLYDLDTYCVALIKGSDFALKLQGKEVFTCPLKNKSCSFMGVGYILSGERWDDLTQKEMIQMEEMSIIEVCVRKANLQILVNYMETIGYSLFRYSSESVLAIQIAMKLGLIEGVEKLSNYKSDVSRCSSNTSEIESLAKTAAVYNQPQMLEQVMIHAEKKTSS